MVKNFSRGLVDAHLACTDVLTTSCFSVWEPARGNLEASCTVQLSRTNFRRGAAWFGAMFPSFQIERETFPCLEQTGEGFLFRFQIEVLNLWDTRPCSRWKHQKLRRATTKVLTMQMRDEHVWSHLALPNPLPRRIFQEVRRQNSLAQERGVGKSQF